jgi:HAMP domain-containing protein
MIALAAELTLHQSVKFVAGAYGVFLALLLIYFAIMALRLRHNSDELADLRRQVEAQQLQSDAPPALEAEQPAAR